MVDDAVIDGIRPLESLDLPVAEYSLWSEAENEKKKNQVFWTCPVLAGGRLWIANSRGEVMSVAVEDGSVRPFVKLGEGVSLAPIVANRTLYVLDDGGKITAFR